MPMLWNMVNVLRPIKMTRPFSSKWTKLGPNNVISKKKVQGKCINCDKVGHKFSKYKLSKKSNKKEANVVDYMAHDMLEINLAAFIYEVSMVGSKPQEW